MVVYYWLKLIKNDKWRSLGSKTKNVKITIEFCILELAFVSDFKLNWQFEILDPICPKWVFWFKNRKSEHHYWVLHIRISLRTKFHLKLITLSFWTWPNLTKQKGILGVKPKKWVFYIRISLNTKLHLELTNLLFFFIKFAQKGYLGSKN